MGYQVTPKMVQRKLLQLRKRTGWPWERMNREFHKVMKAEGPSHTTLFRLGNGNVGRPQPVILHYIDTAINRVNSKRVDKFMKLRKGEK